MCGLAVGAGCTTADKLRVWFHWVPSRPALIAPTVTPTVAPTAALAVTVTVTVTVAATLGFIIVVYILLSIGSGHLVNVVNHFL